jgi:opacity protein-like surface antigen
MCGLLYWSGQSYATEPPTSTDDSFHAVDQAHKEQPAHSTAAHDSEHSEHGAEHAGHGENGSGHESSHESGHGDSSHEGHEGGHNHFAGTFAFITDEAKSTQANITGGPAIFNGVSKSEVAPAAALGVNFAVSPSQTFGIVVSGDLKKGEYGSYESDAATVKLDENSHYEVAFEPGWVLAPKWLGFLIVGVHQASVTAETSINAVDSSETKNMNGFSLGFGSKLVLAEHVFGVFEYQHLKYQSIDIAGIRIAPTSDAFSLGLGYHF